ncbi:MAG: DUF2169 domain-containing protein [Sandaracinaceae bacterium]
MPQLRNYTPFSNFRYYSLDNRGTEFGIVIVKATFDLHGDGALELAAQQAPLVLTDVCHGDVNVSSLRHPSDLVPFKPRGEVLVNAFAHAPRGEPTESWLCGLTVEGGGRRIDKTVRVTGERAWIPEWKRELDAEEAAEWRSHRRDFDGWRLGEPEPTLEIPLRWELAFGGQMPRAPSPDGAARIETDEHNPLGVGWIDRDATDHTRAAPAPRIEDPARPVSDPYERLPPCGLAPIPPAWLPRRPLGGTYDAAWRENVWPKWPADYDFAYHLSSPEGLRWPRFFGGRERVWLRNLLPGGGDVPVTLPGLAIEARFVGAGTRSETRLMNLDTIFLDLAPKPPDARRLFLVWRIRFPKGVFQRIELGTTETNDGAAA